MAVYHLLQVGADVVEVDLGGNGKAAARDLGRLDIDDRKAFSHHVAYGHRDLAHDAAAVGADHMLHLHRLDHCHRLAQPDRIADGDMDGDQRALDRRGQAEAAVGLGQVGRRRSVLCLNMLRLDLGVVGEQRERVTALDPRAGVAGVGRANWRCAGYRGQR